MNTGIKNFLLPLICVAGVLTVSTPFSDVYAQGDSSIKSVVKWFCDDRARYLKLYWIEAEIIERKYKKQDTLYSVEHDREQLIILKRHEKGMGHSFPDVISACVLYWAR